MMEDQNNRRNDLDELLTPRQLAERWGCSRGWLANLRCAGLGPAYLKLGGNVRYRMSAVRAYEDASAVWV